MVKRIVIDGKSIRDIPSFYAEVNRVFMADENWKRR
jgi:RNAse (barnase) inhibitor barstar